MAARAEYASGAVYGNVAYDVPRAAGGYALPQERELPSPQEQQRERIEERLRARENARVRAREEGQTFGVPLLGVVGMLVVAALLIFTLFGYVELAELSGETTNVKNSIAELEEVNTNLKIKCETEFSLMDVEAYATNVLGMIKPAATGSTSHTLTRNDKAEILAEDETAGILSAIRGLFSSVAEYFGG